MLRRSVFLAAVVALCMSVGVSVAAAGGGNSANAQLCQQSGWKSLFTSAGDAFKNQGDCVSYAARGGTLTSACNGTTCTYSDPAANTSVTAPEGALLSVTFGPPHEVYDCGSVGPSIGAIATYVPNPAYTGPSPFDITFRYDATEVQNYIQANDHNPRFCLDKGDGFQFVDSCDSTDGETPCIVDQGFEEAPVDYQVTVSVTESDPRGAMGN